MITAGVTVQGSSSRVVSLDRDNVELACISREPEHEDHVGPEGFQDNWLITLLACARFLLCLLLTFICVKLGYGGGYDDRGGYGGGGGYDRY